MNDSKKKKLSYILLILIIIAGICRFSYGFFVQKESIHSDECWSFGLANSYYEPYIQYSDDTSSFKNVDTWITGETFKEYLTVQKGERFAFGSVYYNLSCDTHPPLYFFLLHFLCSLFPNQYVFWIGFVINMIAYIFMAIFMYKLLLLLTRSEVASLIGVLFSTFSLGMLNMTMFVRMYMCVATVAIIYSYLNAKLYYDKAYRSKISSYVLIALTALVGALTDNFFLPYAFATSAIICICWCIKKEIRVMWKYAVSALAGIALSVIIFPRTFTSMLSSLGINFVDAATQAAQTAQASQTAQPVVNSAYRYMSVPFQFRLALGYINKELFGFSIFNGYKSYASIYISCTIFVLIIILAFLAFLFRKDAWFIKLCSNIKTGIINFFKSFNFITLSLICSVGITCLSAAYITDLYGLGDMGDRYVFVCYPAAMLIMVLFFWRIFSLIIRKRKYIVNILLCVVLAVCTIFSNRITSPYFMRTPNTIKLEDISSDSNFIIISSSKWLLVQYAAKLYGCNEVFLTSDYDFDNQLSKINNHKLSGDTYILIDKTRITGDNAEETRLKLDVKKLSPIYVSSQFNAKQQASSDDVKPMFDLKLVLQKCRSLSFVNDLEYIGCDGVNNYKIDVYKVN